MTDLEAVTDQVGTHLDAILALFKPGAKITVLVRHPSHRDGSRDFVLTSEDDLYEVVRALEIRRGDSGEKSLEPIILSVNVEISDQYGTSKNHVVGVFDNDSALAAARTSIEAQFRSQRIYFKEDRVVLNYPKRIA